MPKRILPDIRQPNFHREGGSEWVIGGEATGYLTVGAVWRGKIPGKRFNAYFITPNSRGESVGRC